MISGYYPVDAGTIRLDDHVLNDDRVQERALRGIARTFQKPRLLGPLSVLDNAMLGGWRDAQAGFLATAFAAAVRCGGTSATLRVRARELLIGVGLAHALDRSANLLEHAEQRFLEIARGLMLRPRFLLLDEPAGGLTADRDRAPRHRNHHSAGCRNRRSAGRAPYRFRVPHLQPRYDTRPRSPRPSWHTRGGAQ